MAVKTYRKKPVVIQAVQWTGQNLFEVITFIQGFPPNIKSNVASDAWDTYRAIVASDGLEIRTLEDGSDWRAKHVASEGDWIIKGVQGEFYPCKPNIFEATYEPAEIPSPQPRASALAALKGDEQ